MENRFGVKDLVIVVLLGIVIVMVGLCMKQYDRQWEQVQQANDQLSHQAVDIAAIRQALKGGVVATTNQISQGNHVVGFERDEKAHAMPDFAAGDTLVGTFLSPPGSITPLVSQELTASQIQSYVQEGLCTRDPDTLQWKPRLASEFKISDDQLTIDFKIRQGVTFSDGSPMSADDVVFTFALARNADLEDPRIRSYLDKLDRVEKTGDDGVRFVFNEPYFKSFETVASMGVLSKSFYSQFTPKQINQSTGLLLGTGPYRLADPTNWKPSPGTPIELFRNERYWGVAPAMNKVVFKIISNPSACVTAFGNGEIDSYTPTPDQYDVMNKDAALVARTQHFAIDVPNAGWMFIAWNQKLDGKPTIFADKRVRTAMTMLLDRQTIVNDILRGYATLNTSCFSPLSPQSDPSIQPLPYDRDKALALLADAGFHLRNDVMVGPDGTPVRFPLAYKQTDPVRVRIASFVKDAMARVGIEIDLKPGELSVLVEQLKQRKMTAYLGAFSGVLESDPNQIFTTAAIPAGGDNFISYSNPEFDAVVAKARAIVADAPRMQVWHQANRILADDQPYTFLFIQKNLAFVDGRFKNVIPTKLGLNSDSEWFVPLAVQKYK